jgi:hypothetical protein
LGLAGDPPEQSAGEIMVRSNSATRELRAPAGHYTFVARSLARRLLMITLLFTLLFTAYAGYVAVTVGGSGPVVVAVVLAVVSVAQWTLLQARIPQRIEVEKSVITIIKSGHRERYDLVDPGVELRVSDGEIAFAHYMKPWSVVHAKDVDWKVFTDVVMHYQNRADLNALLRDQRFES